MEYRLLGRTGIKAGVIGMGCEGFSGKSYAECERMVDFAVENGINLFDMYTSEPELRENVGRALARYPRDKYVIQGHLCSAWRDGQYFRTRNIKDVKEAFENLMTLMQLDYVDIGMIHYADDLGDFDNIMNGDVISYAKELKSAGKIGHIGLSTHNQEVALVAVETGLIDVIMLSINPAYDMLPPSEDVNVLFEDGTFDRVYEGVDPKREALYRRCQSEGVALTVMKAFAGGLLLDEKQSPFGHALTPVQCMSYCLDRPAVASVLGGMTCIDEISDALGYCSADDKDKDYSGILASAPKSSFNGHCMYCGHCAPCTVKIDIASVNKYLDLAEAQGFVPETVGDHYRLLARHAGECVACGKCEKNCPFGVKIIEKMRSAAKLFGM